MRTLLFIAACAISLCARATDPSENFIVSSNILKQDREITVYLPGSYPVEPDKRYRVMYVLDGESNGALVASMNRRMHLSGGANEHIVVSIYSIDRLNDYAPTVNQDPRGPVGAGGGADKFLNFIELELMPEINKNYRTSGARVVMGHSVAGLLVLHSLQSRPYLFHAHLAYSPAVWWGEQETRKAVQQFVISNLESPNYLYMNIGAEAGATREVYDAFANYVLRNRSVDLTIQIEEFAHAGHDFTLLAGLFTSLKSLHHYQQRQ